MYCPNCGLEVNKKYNFCPRCRFNLENILSSTNLADSEPVAKTYTVKLIRQMHPVAYEKWSVKEDLELTETFHQGLTINQLAEKHQRKEGAIRSRLQKLNLIS
jgi:predicted amidophosphoribosyltransferase